MDTKHYQSKTTEKVLQHAVLQCFCDTVKHPYESKIVPFLQQKDATATYIRKKSQICDILGEADRGHWCSIKYSAQTAISLCRTHKDLVLPTVITTHCMKR